MEPDVSVALDLADFITRAPSPYHVTAEAARRLEAAGFSPAAGAADAEAGRGYLVRDGSVLAWSVPESVSEATPVRIVAAHTDSPTFKLKPRPDTGAAGWRQAAVEIYGSPLWNSWLDRDLGVAGRLALLDGSTVLVNVDRPLLRVPQLAPHLDRGVNQRGLQLDPQRHLTPVWGTGQPRAGELVEFLAAEAGLRATDVAAHDLVLHDLNPPALLGRDRELLAAPRLDNLSSTYCGLAGFLAAAAAVTVTRSSSTPPSTTRKSAAARPPARPDRCSVRCCGRSGPPTGSGCCPTTRRWPARCACPPTRPTGCTRTTWNTTTRTTGRVPGEGPALKFHAAHRYATDGPGAAAWARACRQAGVPSQVFVSRNNIQCGTTIGPILAARTGIRTVDVGLPVLSMHSARELCGSADPGYLAAACTAFLAPA